MEAELVIQCSEGWGHEVQLLITGASGLLGSAVAHLAEGQSHGVCSAYNQHRPSIGASVKLDLTDLSHIDRVMGEANADAIIHAAALTDVDRCERERDLAERVNSEATAAIASAARAIKAFLVYVSTDYVFSGEKGLYSEGDEPSPVNFYGYTKLKGEESVRERANDYCIARASVIYGAVPASGKVNFALWLIERLSRGDRVDVLEDQYVSPTLNLNLAEMILEVAERKLGGIYHLAGAERVSRYQFAMNLCDTLGLDSSLLNPVSMKYMKWIACRPKDSSLNVSKATKVLKAKPLKLTEALARLKHAV